MSSALDKFQQRGTSFSLTKTKIGKTLLLAMTALTLSVSAMAEATMQPVPMVQAPSMPHSSYVPSNDSYGNLYQELKDAGIADHLSVSVQNAIQNYGISQPNLYATSQMKEATQAEKASVKPYIQAKILSEFSTDAHGNLTIETGAQSFSVVNFVAGNPKSITPYIANKKAAYQRMLSRTVAMLRENEQRHPENKQLPTALRAATGMQQIYNERQMMWTPEQRKYTATYLWSLKEVAPDWAKQLPQEKVSSKIGLPQVAKSLETYHKKATRSLPQPTAQKKPSLYLS